MFNIFSPIEWRVKFNDWLVQFIVNNEIRILERETKNMKKGQKADVSIIDEPKPVAYPKIQYINEGLYYKQIVHPGRPRIKVFINSLDLWAVQSLLTASSFDTSMQTNKKMRDLFMMLNKIDSYNNLKPWLYTYTNLEGLIQISGTPVRDL
jgi:hypothetical protein